MKRVALALIFLYQRALSPYVPAMCRYSPTCSDYSHQAVQDYGVLRGTWLTMKRLSRCRPLGGRGYDPVP